MNYSEKLKDPRWQKKRLLVLSRDNFTCQRCKRTDRTLHVHHKMYFSDSDPWEYSDNFLITLCEVCHQREPEKMKHNLQRLTATLHENNFDSEDVDVLMVLIRSKRIMDCLIKRKFIYGFENEQIGQFVENMEKKFFEEMREFDKTFYGNGS